MLQDFILTYFRLPLPGCWGTSCWPYWIVSLPHRLKRGRFPLEGSLGSAMHSMAHQLPGSTYSHFQSLGQDLWPEPDRPQSPIIHKSAQRCTPPQETHSSHHISRLCWATGIDEDCIWALWRASGFQVIADKERLHQASILFTSELDHIARPSRFDWKGLGERASQSKNGKELHGEPFDCNSGLWVRKVQLLEDLRKRREAVAGFFQTYKGTDSACSLELLVLVYQVWRLWSFSSLVSWPFELKLTSLDLAAPLDSTWHGLDGVWVFSECHLPITPYVFFSSFFIDISRYDPVQPSCPG